MSLFSAKDVIELNVEGMHCPKCVARVTEALEAVDGVTATDVRLDDNAATVEGHGLDAEALMAAIRAIDFEASLAE